MAVIRHEFVLVNNEITSGNYTAVQVKLSPANYSGTCTWYIESPGATGSGTTSLILKDLAGNTHATLDFTETSPTLKRAEFSTPPTADNYYASVSGNGAVYNPKIVCLQDVGDSCSGSEVQIEIGGYVSTTSTSPVPLPEPKYFTYNSADWDGTIALYFEACGGIDSPGIATFYLEEDDGSWGNWTSIASVTISGYGLATRSSDVSSFLTNGRHYRVSIKTSNASYDANNYLAKLVFVQTGTVTKLLETVTMLSNSDAVGDYGTQPESAARYLAADWTDSNVSFKYAQDALSSADGSKLYNITDSADVTPVIYGPNQQVSSAITLPDSGDILTPNVTNWQDGINHCLLLAYVALSYSPSAEGGSSASVSAAASGAGMKMASGGSSASVSNVASGAGIKATSGGASVSIAVAASGGGEAIKPPIEGGSSQTVTVTASADGIKMAHGPPSSIGVDVDASGQGVSIRQGGSGVSVSVSVNGEGIKEAHGSSGATVTVTAEGAGEPFDDTIKGGSSATVTITGNGAGTKAAHGGSSASVSANALGAGETMRAGGNGAIVSVSATGQGRGGFSPLHITITVVKRRSTIEAGDRNCTIEIADRDCILKVLRQAVSLEVIE